MADSIDQDAMRHEVNAVWKMEVNNALQHFFGLKDREALRSKLVELLAVRNQALKIIKELGSDPV